MNDNTNNQIPQEIQDLVKQQNGLQDQQNAMGIYPYQPYGGVCPSCGRCQHCGRGGGWQPPYAIWC